MVVSSLRIQNFRGLKELTIHPSSSTCIIGKNNAGKSSVLMAMDTAMGMQRPMPTDFYHDSDQMVVEMQIDGILETDLNRLVKEHKDKVRSYVFDNGVSLRYIANLHDKPKIEVLQKFPANEILRKAEEAVKGMRVPALKEFIAENLPDYADKFEDLKGITDFKERLLQIKDALPDEELTSEFAPLGTGIPTSITQLLPEVIYVPAVKDLGAETRTKESAAFGKLIKLILRQIEESEVFKKFQNSFAELNKLLNKSTSDEEEDKRISDLAWIESTLQKYLGEHFAETSVSIKIGSPELKHVLGNAEIYVDDGVETLIENKGDGIKRAMLFSLIRTYVDLQRKIGNKGKDKEEGTRIRPYLFLFEEPELFLYPSAQHKLFSAICDLKDFGHQVIITTHSPIFLRPGATTNFVKLRKVNLEGLLCTRALSLDLTTDLSAKNAFKLICYENNAVALFADKVLLVEGDTDQAYLPGIAKLLNSEWDFDQPGVAIIQTGGKQSVGMFRKFFHHFEVDTYVIVDADALADGYKKLGLPEELVQECGNIQQLLDEYQGKGDVGVVDGKKAKSFFEQYTWVQKHERLMQVCENLHAGKPPTDEDLHFVKHLKSGKKQFKKRAAILDRNYEQARLDDLFDKLRRERVAILSHGDIEQYFPPGEITGQGKPERALAAVELASKKDVLDLPKTVIDGKPHCELTAIFSHFFA